MDFINCFCAGRNLSFRQPVDLFENYAADPARASVFNLPERIFRDNLRRFVLRAEILLTSRMGNNRASDCGFPRQYLYGDEHGKVFRIQFDGFVSQIACAICFDCLGILVRPSKKILIKSPKILNIIQFQK